MSHLFPIFRYLDTVGDGTGIKNANGNYSVTPQTFKIIVPPSHGYTLTNLLIHISGTTSFKLNGYGSIVGGLINGITMQISMDGNIQEMNDGLPIKTNSDWGHISQFINHIDYPGTGDNLIVPYIMADFGIPLDLSSGDYVQLTLNDDFTSLDSQHFVAHGFRN